ncbi:MAG: PIN domain-containing protein [Firmicutes bacterium]|nr:PIN domain-containing protein [Bacillota bacterium]
MKNILIDTSVWVEYFKGNPLVASMVNEREDYSVYITGPVITELIQGLKTEKEKDIFANSLESLPRLIVSDQDWFDAGLFGAQLRSKGITVPLADLIIYTVARNSNCSICTLDQHFNTIDNTLGPKVEILGL